MFQNDAWCNISELGGAKFTINHGTVFKQDPDEGHRWWLKRRCESKLISCVIRNLGLYIIFFQLDEHFPKIMVQYHCMAWSNVLSVTMFTVRQCSQCDNVYSATMFTMRQCSQCDNVHNATMFTMRQCPQCDNVHNATMFTMRQCSQCDNVHNVSEPGTYPTPAPSGRDPPGRLPHGDDGQGH